MAKISIEDYEKIDPMVRLEYAGKKIIYCIPNRQTMWRVESIQTKEPDTLEWIAKFSADDVLLDIGANVGMYTVWAAVTKGCTVISFEPEAQNFALLNKNIYANQLQDRVVAYPLAISDTSGLGDLFLSSFMVGGSCHSFGESVDIHLKPRTAPYRQGCMSFSIDELIGQEMIPLPTRIKIDVDGIEHKIIDGAERTLSDHRVKSVLVELNTHLPSHRDIIERMEAKGFTLLREMLEISIRKEGDFEGVGNHIFERL